jgi:TPR repeat protein
LGKVSALRNFRTALALAPIALLAACADLGTARSDITLHKYDVARANLEELSRRGFPQAQTKLGEMYQDGLGVPKDPAKALALYRQAEKNEQYPEAIIDIGKAYRTGEGVPQNTAKAREYFQRAERLGAADASVQLGLLEQDAGNYGAAESLFRKGLAAGDMDALVALGKLRAAQGRPQEAEEFLKQALSNGNPNAWFTLGRLHADQKQYARAQSDFEHALNDTGNLEAYLKIGDMQLAQGNAQAAEATYKSALARGVKEADVRIGSMYRVKGDYTQALIWYYRARADGVPGVEEKIAHAEKKLQPEELAKALEADNRYKGKGNRK